MHVWGISGTAVVAVGAIFFIWIGASEPDAGEAHRAVPGSQGASSDGTAPAGRSLTGAGNQSGAESDWPGLPPAVPGVDDAIAPLQPEPTEHELAPALPLAELVDSFDELEAHQRGEAAYRIASGWMDCRGHRERDDAALRDEAVRFVEDRSRRLTEMAAQALEAGAGSQVAGAVDQAIREFAQKRRETHIAEKLRALRETRDFCRGVDNPGFDERNLRYFDWLERAADLGHPPARVVFARIAFFWSETVSVGKATELVERKRKVAASLRQAVARRNAWALEAIAGIVGKGYYARPDPVLEYAYSLAAMHALSGDAVGWHFGASDKPDGNDLNISLLRGRIEKLESTLNLDDIRRAERLSEHIVGMDPS